MNKVGDITDQEKKYLKRMANHSLARAKERLVEINRKERAKKSHLKRLELHAEIEKEQKRKKEALKVKF